MRLFFSVLLALVILSGCATGYRPYEPATERLRKNPISGEWTYERIDAKLKKNPINGEWEFV